MKILHFSDSHLWISLENTLREEDFYQNFERVINEIIKIKPDFVIHSGDLFHTSKPSNKAISVVVENFLKLEKLSIKTIIIAWNHDTPRLSTTTHPFEIFQSLKDFYVYFEPKIQKISFWNINIITLPHIHDENIFLGDFLKSKELLEIWKINIFVSHFGISAQEYDEYTDEISWVNITIEQLQLLKSFDYVALGHYHKQFCIKNMCYPWSWEHTSFNQKDYKIGYNLFDTDSKKIELFQTSSRKMFDLWIIDCSDFENTLDLIEYLDKNLDKSNLKWSIIKIVLENIKTHFLLEFQEKILLDFFKVTFYFEYKKIRYIDIKSTWSKIIDNWNIILDNFFDFFDKYELQDKKINKKELKENLANLISKI